MNTDQHTQHRFEERLLAELRSSIVAHPSSSPVRRHRRRLPGVTTWWRRRLALAGGTAALLAVAAAAGVPFLTDGSTPAYAVSTNNDGTVTVEINSLSDAAGLERKLREAGVPAVVQYLPAGKACKEPWFTPASPRSGNGITTSGVEKTGEGHTRFTIDPGTLPPEETLVIQTQDDGAASGPSEAAGPSSVAIAYAKGEVEPCDVVDAPAGGVPPPPGGTVHGNATNGGTGTGLERSLHVSP